MNTTRALLLALMCGCFIAVAHAAPADADPGGPESAQKPDVLDEVLINARKEKRHELREFNGRWFVWD